MLESISNALGRLLERVIVTAPSFLVTLFVILVVHLVVSGLLKKIGKEMGDLVEHKSTGGPEARKRVETLNKVFSKTAFLVVWGVGSMMLLKKLGVDIGPILAAAGVLGLAIGFGAQNLARDFISGLFILLENSIRVGDVAAINGTAGVVEEINLRTVILRDATGTVHTFPNGTIATMANMTKDWSAFVIDMGVAYKEDVDTVMGVMKAVATEMRAESPLGADFLDDMEMWGLDAFGDSAVVVKGRIKTKPGKQHGVAREYRRRLKLAFDAKGIEIPFPHMSIYVGEKTQPLEVLLQQKQA